MKMKEFKTAGGVARGWGFGHPTTYYLYGCSRRPSRRCGGQSSGPKSSWAKEPNNHQARSQGVPSGLQGAMLEF